MSLVICLPYCHRDQQLALKLLQWIAVLNGGAPHSERYSLLLVYDVKRASTAPLMDAAKAAFTLVDSLAIHNAPDADWSAGTGDARACNEMWIQTAWHMDQRIKQPWLWLEPDCTPITANWLDKLAAEYAQQRKNFMGAEVTPSAGPVRMSGVAIYPAHVCRYSTKALMSEQVPWDIEGAEDFLKDCRFTPLIQHVLRTSAEAPTFPDQESLKLLREDAVLFHPCKDLSLRDRLVEREHGLAFRGERPALLATAHDGDLADPIPKAHVVAAQVHTELSESPAPVLTEALCIEFLSTLAHRSGIDKGRITKRLRTAGVIK